MINRLPPWLKQEIPDRTVFERLRLISALGVNTVCLEAKCPNLNECFSRGKLTFLILGDTCSRSCNFCAIKQSSPGAIRQDEPKQVSQIARALGLKYVVLTSVTRDDLPDGGAGVFARTIRLIKGIDNKIKVEVLIPDFSGNLSSLQTVIAAGPCVLGHNLETVRRLHRELKPQADYERSLELLSRSKEINPILATKSSLLLGLGEKEKEVEEAMADLRGVDCDILTLGQYLAPGKTHYPVKEFIAPQDFRRYDELAKDLGFKAVLSGPLVRSSYQAESIYANL